MKFFTKKISIILLTLMLLIALGCATKQAPQSTKQDLQSATRAVDVTSQLSTGENPGNIKFYLYTPDGLTGPAPLVVALHGCSQQATGDWVGFNWLTGWSDLADQKKFYVLYPEQTASNNGSKCFNWGGDPNTDNADMDPAGAIRKGVSYTWNGQTKTNEGDEPGSIMNMIEKIKSLHDVDSSKVFVTGLSAGGYMSVLLAAIYPDVFAAVAPMAGGPYLCNREESSKFTSTQAYNCMSPGRDLTPQQWGDMARQYNGYDEPANMKWPRMQIWQGTSDTMVKPINAQEIVDQWTNLHGIDNTADETTTLKGNELKKYKNGSQSLVEVILVNGMGHGTAVDPGDGEDQGGNGGAWSESKGIWSSYYAYEFFMAGGPVDSAPTVTLTGPAASVASGTVQITADAIDDNGVTRVEFYVGTTKIGEDTTAPYEINWVASAGSYTVKVIAFDTIDQNSEDAKTVTVCDGECADNPPTIDITNPINGASLNEGNITIAVNATDDNGVSKVEFYSGTTKVGEDTAAPFSYTMAGSEGSYTIKAIAYDTINQTAEDTVSFTVSKSNIEPGNPVCKSLGTFGAFTTNECYAENKMEGKTAEPRALVLSFHGWTHQDMPQGTEWAKLGATYGFYVVYPETAGKASQDWHTAGRSRNGSQPKAVISIVEAMKAKHNIDVNKIYVTGLSAGGYFSVNLVSDYPEVFAGAAIFSGGPHGCTTACMGNGSGDNGAKIKAENSSYWNDVSTRKPRVISWHGTSDAIVSPTNQEALKKQYLGALGIDETPDNNGSKIKEGHTGHEYKEYRNGNGELMYATVTIQDMAHAISVDPGTGEDQGGQAVGMYAKDFDIYAPYYSAKFWGILSSSPVDNPPTVSITSPGNGANVGAGNVSIAASATDDKGVLRVDFFVDGTKISEDTTAPYTAIWDAANAAEGSHTIKAIAYDTISQSSTPYEISVVGGGKVDTQSPVVSVTSPGNGQELIGEATITVNATDDYGVVKVDCLVDGIVIKTDTTAPYTCDVNFDNYAEGAHTVSAKAYDAKGNEGVSSVINITSKKVVWVCKTHEGTNLEHVDAGRAEAYDQYTIKYVKAIGSGDEMGQLGSTWFSTPNTLYEPTQGYFTLTACSTEDTQAPTSVLVTSPVNGSEVTGNVIITASGSDNVGITKYKFYVDNVEIGEAASQYTWDASGETVGSSHTIKVEAFDAAGNHTMSSAITVTIKDGGGTCTEYTATGSAHMTAGRVYRTSVGWLSYDYFAEGSDEALGNNKYYTTITLYEVSPGVYKTTCN